MLKDSPAFTHSARAKTSIFKTQFLEISAVVGPVTPALLSLPTLSRITRPAYGEGFECQRDVKSDFESHSDNDF